jgi:hypothetical protein
MDKQEGEITKRELTAEELDAVSGGLLNSQTQLYHSFMAGMVKGYADAGGTVLIKFS